MPRAPLFCQETMWRLFATLTGKRSRVGSIEEILGEKGFGRLTRPFVPNELVAVDTALRAAEARLDAARREHLSQRFEASLRAQPIGR